MALDAGTVDLRRGSRLRDTGNYLVTSPPAVAGDTLVVGSAIGDNRAVELEYGVVRAFDARTGAQRWAWDPLPRNRPGASARRDWQAQQLHRTGGANAWSIISVDEQAGRVFVPTGAPSPDFYGGTRLGRNLYANSLVALDLETGERAWHFQFVHHDLPALGLGPQDDAGRRTPPASAARRCQRGPCTAVIRMDPQPAEWWTHTPCLDTAVHGPLYLPVQHPSARHGPSGCRAGMYSAGARAGTTQSRPRAALHSARPR